ncbi:MAG: T9SS type A sorting domain-containing protein, partial [Salinibacter sp.]
MHVAHCVSAEYPSAKQLLMVQRRRPGGKGGQKVGYRESKAQGGTSSGPRTYRFTDGSLPYGADTLSYRLRQVDTDGSARATAPITVARGAVKELQLKETYPNPAHSRVTVRYAIPEQGGSGKRTLRLYDLLGRKVRTAQAQVKAVRLVATLDVSGLPSGVYLLRLAAGGEAQIRRLTVVRER